MCKLLQNAYYPDLVNNVNYDLNLSSSKVSNFDIQ